MKSSSGTSLSTQLTRILLAGASCGSIAALSWAGLAPSLASAAEQAAPADDTAVQAVVVTGLRGSIESSILAKKTSDSIIESVTAEDIGKLPDVSIAESLARLPGVAAQRVDGRAQELSIRGMAPKFAVTLLDGNEIVSTGDDRSFQYDQFPSELVSSVTIYKTPDVALGTQGLAGTVDIRTVRPLDYHQRKVSLSARAEDNSFGSVLPGSKSTGSRLNASYVDQFQDGTIGVALGFAHLDSPTEKKYFNPWDFGKGPDISVDGVGNSYVFDGFETGVAATKEIRDGYLGAFEFKPNANFHSQINVFHSQFKQRMNGREFIGVISNWANGSAPVASLTSSSPITMAVTNATPIITTRKDNREDHVDALNWSTEAALGEWTAKADLSWSRARRHELVGEAYATTPAPVNFNVRFGTDYNGFSSVSSATNFGDPANWLLSTAWWGGGGYLNEAHVTDEMKSAHVSARRALSWGPFSAFEGGVIYAERTKDLAYVGTNLNLAASATACDVGSCLAIPHALLKSPANLSFVGIPGLVSFDVLDELKSGLLVASPSDPKSPNWNWGVDEKVATAFGKLNVETHFIVPVHGNVGVQLVSADQHATGLYVDGNGGITPVSGGTSYTDVLPSLNLIGDLGASGLLRFGLGKAVARPNMADMRAGITASVDQTTHLWSGSGGNPKLEPWRSVNIDLSWEKYFSKGTYVAIALFDKEISNGIATKDVVYNFAGYVNPTGITPLSNLGTLSTPTNTKGGNDRGYELSGAVEGGFIHPLLDGFGAVASYSHSDSNLPGTDANGVPINTTPEGLSGDVESLTVYYEKGGFEARIGQRYRSAFNAPRHNAFKFVMDSIRPENITDFQIGYTFSSGSLKGIGVQFQANNIFNTPYVVTQTVDNITTLKEYHEFGSQYLIGVTYRY